MQAFRNGELVWCVEPIWGKEGISVVGLVAWSGVSQPKQGEEGIRVCGTSSVGCQQSSVGCQQRPGGVKSKREALGQGFEPRWARGQ